MNDLIENIEQIHSTELGIERIRKNLGLGAVDVVLWCRNKILDENSRIERQGKNWYIYYEDCVITVNATSYTIITAHKVCSSGSIENRKKKNVFVLWHVYEQTDDYGVHDEEKLIGIYSSRKKAEEAIELHKDLEGFRDHPAECFEIHETELNRSSWDTGFTTVRYNE